MHGKYFAAAAAFLSAGIAVAWKPTSDAVVVALVLAVSGCIVAT